MFVPSKYETKKYIFLQMLGIFQEQNLIQQILKPKVYLQKQEEKRQKNHIYLKKILQKILKQTKPSNKIST